MKLSETLCNPCTTFPTAASVCRPTTSRGHIGKMAVQQVEVESAGALRQQGVVGTRSASPWGLALTCSVRPRRRDQAAASSVLICAGWRHWQIEFSLKRGVC